MLSRTKTSSNKSIQDEIHSESKETSIITKKLIHTTFASIENCQMHKNSVCEIEKNDLKETKKQEKMQLENEISKLLIPECPKLDIIDLKNNESKVENIETKDKSKSPSSIVLNEANVSEYKMIPINKDTQELSNVAVPRKYPPLSTPVLNERPLVLTTHLVPSLPINLFEVFVEAIEVATEKPVVLLYEPRSDRPIAKEVADIAILPANREWEDGKLLPVSFSFEHHLNKDNSSCVYADVIVASDRAQHVQDIIDFRGHRCSLPDRKKNTGAATLLFNYLYTKGENPAFFGNILDADTQVATLQMVAGKQAEIGILESPVIKCHKNTLPGIDSLHILTSLGPLPPYRIMVRKTFSDILAKKITTYLLNLNQDKKWIDRFAPFGVIGFTKNFEKLYNFDGIKSVITSVPYY
ncbi:uncharacterized protein LOC108000036 isoform X1 [Apis cerana]|uniref:uncharacterized protein LOC108000036 isoform X1 n=1 Tax=Apis cerana TaxID=7461 RepID=UPI0007E2D213|nr:uncharacterized protein LOC108000036 isoform X1 [Apis cerana]